MKIMVATLLGAFQLVQKLVDSLIRWKPQRYFPVPEWGRPAGPHAVGVHDVTFNKETSRRLMARIWYPAETIDGCQRHQLFSDIAEQQAIAAGFAGGLALTPLMMTRINQIQTWSFVDAPPTQSGALPVLVFSHGLSGYVGQNTHLAEHLSSHGFIVIALAHPHGACTVRFDDGTFADIATELGPAQMNGADFKRMLALMRAKNLKARLIATRESATNPVHVAEQEKWVDDISSAISWFFSEHQDPLVSALVSIADPGRVAAAGMSFGGSASVTAAQRDARIRVAINLDGGQIGTELLNVQTKVAVLMMHSEAIVFADGGAYNDFYYEPFAQAGCSGIVHRYVVKGSGHTDFSDLTVCGRHLVRKLLHLGKIDGQRMLDITAELTRRFLEQNLNGKSGSFPADVCQRWPELKKLDVQALRGVDLT